MNIFSAILSLMITIAAILSCHRISSVPIKKHCTECTELLREEIEHTLDNLRISSDCMDKNHPSPAVLGTSHKHITKENIDVKMTNFFLELKTLEHSWVKNVGGPFCLQNLDSSFTRILCLLKSVKHRKGKCVHKINFSAPSFSTIGYTKNFISDVYRTLDGFVSNLPK